MKTPLTILLTLTLLLLVGCQDSITGFETNSDEAASGISSSPFGTSASSTETTIHNNGKEVGGVLISNDGYELSIDVELAGEGDYFLKRNVHVGSDLEDIRNPAGLPTPGKMEDKKSFTDPYPSSFVIEITLDEDDDVYVDDEGEKWVYIAVHAEASIDGETEGLWVGDPGENRFHEKKNGNGNGGNWATYFEYNLTTGEVSCVIGEQVWVDGLSQTEIDKPFTYVELETLTVGDVLEFGEGEGDEFLASGEAEVTEVGDTYTLVFTALHDLELEWVRHKLASTDLDDNNPVPGQGWTQTQNNPGGLGDPSTLSVTPDENDTRLYLLANFEDDCENEEEE